MQRKKQHSTENAMTPTLQRKAEYFAADGKGEEKWFYLINIDYDSYLILKAKNGRFSTLSLNKEFESNHFD